jgi:hypothetical protein
VCPPAGLLSLSLLLPRRGAPAGLLSLSLLLPRRGAPAGLLSLLSHLLPHLLPHLPVPHLLPPLLAPLSYLLPHLLPHLLPPLSYMLPPLRSHSLQEHQKSGLSSPRTTQSRARTTEIVHETREGRHPFQPPSAEAVLLNLQDQSSRRELFRQPEHPLPTLHLVPTSASPQLPHHLYRRRARGEARVNSLTTYTEAELVGKCINVR